MKLEEAIERINKCKEDGCQFADFEINDLDSNVRKGLEYLGYSVGLSMTMWDEWYRIKWS